MKKIMVIKLTNFSDAIGKIDEDKIKEISDFSCKTFDIESSHMIQLVPMDQSGNYSSGFIPLKMFAEKDTMNDAITMKTDDVAFVYEPSSEMENAFREYIGDVVPASNTIVTP